MSIYKCELCDSENTELVAEKRDVDIPFVGEMEIESYHVHCNNCGYEFYPEDQEEKYVKDLAKLAGDSVPSLINSLVEKTQYNLSGIERAMDLPQRTLTKWKNHQQTPSSAGIALLRALNTYPHIVDIAARNYDSNAIMAFSCNFNYMASTSKQMEIKGLGITFTEEKTESLSGHVDGVFSYVY